MENTEDVMKMKMKTKMIRTKMTLIAVMNMMMMMIEMRKMLMMNILKVKCCFIKLRTKYISNLIRLWMKEI